MAKITHSLNIKTREILGSKVQTLRRSGLTPSNIYGKGLKSVAVMADSKELLKIFNEVGESALVEVNLDDKEKYPVLFKNPAFDAVAGDLMHVDMYKVDMKQKITTTIPLHLVGEAPAVKQGLLLMEVTMEIEIECLPSQLPESIEVDLGKLEKVDDMITVANLNLGKDIEIMTEADAVIVKVIEAQQAEVVEEAPKEVEVITEKKEESTEAGTEAPAEKA